MTLSAKWTAVSFFALSTLGAASFAFAGCTVTSGKIDDIEGGTGNPNPNTDSGVGTDAGGDAAVAAVCEGNTNQKVDFTPLGAGCQACLNTKCCTELKGCFNIVPDQDASAGGSDDCNKYSTCIPSCLKKVDGTPETDTTKIAACQKDCDDLTQPAVRTAYETLFGDGTAANAGCTKTNCKTECGQ
jgi:hypothetical protein